MKKLSACKHRCQRRAAGSRSLIIARNRQPTQRKYAQSGYNAGHTEIFIASSLT